MFELTDEINEYKNYFRIKITINIFLFAKKTIFLSQKKEIYPFLMKYHFANIDNLPSMQITEL
ncbi:hypothetical protein GCM10019993_06930 [Enterococcus pseudoavium]